MTKRVCVFYPGVVAEWLNASTPNTTWSSPVGLEFESDSGHR